MIRNARTTLGILAIATALALAIPLVASGEPLCVEVPVANDRCPSWTVTHDVPGGDGTDEASDVVATDDVVVVAGPVGTGTPAVELVGLDPESGQERWTSRVDGVVGGFGDTTALSVAPDGSAVFLAGNTSESDILVASLDSATGALLWTTTYDGGGTEYAQDLAVAPDSAEVYVTGSSHAPGERQGLILVALSAEDGGELWTMRYQGPTRYYAARDTGHTVRVSPDGERVYVAGRSTGSSSLEGTNFDLVTLAYDVPGVDEAPSSQWAWAGRFTVALNAGVSGRVGLGVSDDGSRVVMSGEGDNNFWTVGYDAAGGQELWSGELHGTPVSRGWVSTLDEAKVEISGDRVFVAISKAWDPGPLLASYDLGTGEEQWTTRYPAGPPLETSAMVLAPDGGTIYTLASTLDVTYGASVAAFDPETGEQRWVGRMNAADEDVFGNGLAISPSGDALFATGGLSTYEVDGQELTRATDFFTWSYSI